MSQTSPFRPLAQAYKFAIGSVPEQGIDDITVEAQYNPKELQIDGQIGWKPQGAIAEHINPERPMEFTGMQPESVKIELMFDAYEDDGKDGDNSVVEKVAMLRQLASARIANLKTKAAKSSPSQRPSYCVATWGTQAAFRCVIDSISVKYLMFAPDGTPLRATVTLGLKSGKRPLSNEGDTAFERASMAKLEEKRQALEKTREVRRGEAREELRTGVQQHRTAYDSQEGRVEKRERLEREAAEQRERERQAALREREAALREQRKRDFELE